MCVCVFVGLGVGEWVGRRASEVAEFRGDERVFICNFVCWELG